MDTQNKLIWQFRLVYLLIGLVLLGAVMGPIMYKVPDYPFFWDNIFFIVGAWVFFYWIFFLRFTWFGKNKWVKLVILFTTIPMILFFLGRFTNFQTYIDDYGIQTFLDHLSHQEYLSLGKFIKTEMLFFGTACVISLIIVAFRMIYSIWRYRNKGLV